MFPSAEEYQQIIQLRDQSPFCTLAGLHFVPVAEKKEKHSIVFRAEEGDDIFAIKFFTGDAVELSVRYQELARWLDTINPSWKVDFTLLKKELKWKGKTYPVVKSKKIIGETLRECIDGNVEHRSALTRLQRLLVGLSRELEKEGISHGNLGPETIIVTVNEQGEPSLELVDYDAMYIPAFAGKPMLENGHPDLQHTGRSSMPFDERIDRFSFWVMLTALEALKYDPALWKSIRNGGFNNGSNMLFTENDWKHFDQSALLQRLYAMNEEPLNFYLYALNRFCSSLSRYIEEPEMHGVEWEEEVGNAAGEVQALVNEIPHPVTSIPQNTEINIEYSSPGAEEALPMTDHETLQQQEMDETPDEVSQSSQHYAVPDLAEVKGERSAMTYTRLALIIAGLLFAGIMIYNSYNKRNKVGRDRVADAVNDESDARSNISENRVLNNVAATLTKKYLEQDSIDRQRKRDSLMSSINLDYLAPEFDSVPVSTLSSVDRKDETSIQSSEQSELQTDDAATGDPAVDEDLMGEVDTMAMTGDEANKKGETILAFFNLVKNKECEKAWKYVNVPAIKNKGKAAFCAVDAFGGMWEIEVDAIQMMNYSAKSVNFNVAYYTFHIYDGARMFEQQIQVTRNEGKVPEWTIKSMRDIEAPYKCPKR